MTVVKSNARFLSFTLARQNDNNMQNDNIPKDCVANFL